jgi:cytochrome c oxidase subunit 1
MMGAGTLGVSRRHWDITFSEAALSFDYPGMAFLMMGLNGIFGVIAGIGGLMFVLVVVGSLLFGKPRGAAEVKANPVVAGGEAASTYGSGDAQAAGDDHPGEHLLPRLRPLLLHQLEIPLGGLAAELSG